MGRDDRLRAGAAVLSDWTAPALPKRLISLIALSLPILERLAYPQLSKESSSVLD